MIRTSDTMFYNIEKLLTKESCSPTLVPQLIISFPWSSQGYLFFLCNLSGIFQVYLSNFYSQSNLIVILFVFLLL